MNEEDTKFEDFIQGLYDTDKEPSDEEWLDNVVAALLICPNPALNYCRKLLMSFAV